MYLPISWTDEPGFTFHKVGILPVTSFLSVLSFSKNSAKALRRAKFDCIVSFERTEYQDIYRAGDGCHKAWLEIRSEIEAAYRRFSFSINPLHRYTLSLEKNIFQNTSLIVVNSSDGERTDPEILRNSRRQDNSGLQWCRSEQIFTCQPGKMASRDATDHGHRRA